MTKDKRGTKRLCEGCEKRFYDLGRDPIICPMCETPFIVEKPKPKPKPRAAPAPAPAPAPAEKAAEPKAEEAAAPEAAEPEAAEPEAAEPEAAAPDDKAAAAEPEIVSLDEAAEEEEIDDEAKLADLGDDEADIPPDDNPDVFIEEDEEDGGSNVTEIIGAPIETKEET